MMNRLGEESQSDPNLITGERAKNPFEEFSGETPLRFGGLRGENTLLQEGVYPPLNLTFTLDHDLLNSIESTLQKDRQKPPYSIENTKIFLTQPPETAKNTEKQKAINFQFSKITVGEWTHKSVYPDDLKAKFYFAKMRLMWEVLDESSKLKRKIEMHWSDVLSYKATIHPQETLEVELGKCPTFFMETNPQPGKHTQWAPLDEDFTLNHSASRYRRHTIHFSPGDLKKNWEKIVSADSFWLKLGKVKFPTLPQSLYFDTGYGNSNNNDSSNLSPYGHCTTLPQGFGHAPVDDVNFNMATQFGRNAQKDPFVQHNHQTETMHQLPRIQVINPSQLMNIRRAIRGSGFNNPLIQQDERQMSNTWVLRGSQASSQETKPNSMIFPHPNDLARSKVGQYRQDILAQEEVIHTMKCIHQFQTYRKCTCDQRFSNTNGSLPPDL